MALTHPVILGESVMLPLPDGRDHLNHLLPRQLAAARMRPWTDNQIRSA